MAQMQRIKRYIEPYRKTEHQAENIKASTSTPARDMVDSGAFEHAGVNGLNIDNERFHIIQQEIMAAISPAVVVKLTPAELEARTFSAVGDIAAKMQFPIGNTEQQQITQLLVDEMLGLGPLQVFMDDPAVTDILVNGHDEVFIESQGKVKKVNVRFRDEAHVLNLARRIVSRIGRRVDETTPMVDARLADGSRVNVLIPPLALNGTCISIRKFSEQKRSLQQLAELGAMSPAMAVILDIIARSRVNVLVSGGYWCR